MMCLPHFPQTVIQVIQVEINTSYSADDYSEVPGDAGAQPLDRVRSGDGRIDRAKAHGMWDRIKPYCMIHIIIICNM